MKKTIFTLIALFAYAYSFATIRRVNNNPGVVAVTGLVYNTLASALTDAVNGDTLYLEPSATSYDLVSPSNITKRLVWYGNGYQIGQNTGLISPLPYSVLESKISSSLNFQSGSANSILYGINFESGNVTIQAGNNQVEFHRCSFSNDLQILGSNNLINQCFFGLSSSIFGNGINNIIKNSIIGEAFMSQIGAIVDNCYIQSIGFGSSGMPESCTFTNSIILHTATNTPLTNTFTNCMKLVNNTTSTTTFPVPAINNNLENVAIANVFVVTDPGVLNPRKDRDYRLKSGSPAIGTGIGGIDMGVFGGASPYRLSGQAPVPVITNFFLSTTGSTASGLSGSITIQTNN